MTFDEFQQHCNQVISTNYPLQLPCPIVIGTGEAHAYVGDTPSHHLIIFKEPPNNAVLQSIYRSVTFSFAATENAVVITPLTKS